MKISKKIDVNTVYKFPKDIRVVRHKDKILVVAKDFGNWIVLENERQLDFFLLLNSHSIETCISKFHGTKEDINYVITQIEARQLYRTEITTAQFDNQLHFYLTNGCNLCCPHCYMIAGKKNENELTATEIKSFLKEYRNYGNYVTFSGGEITTRSDLLEILEFSNLQGYRIRIMTNGTLWTEELIEKTSQIVESVQISIDGYDEESNAKIRGNGNFQKALDTVDKFIKNRVPVEIAITPLYERKFPIEKYIHFSEKLYSKYGDKIGITLAGEMLKGRNVDYSDDELREYSENAKKFLEITTGANTDEGFINYKRKFEIHPNCNYGNYFIASNGDIYLCSVIEMMKPVGNIRNLKMPQIAAIVEKARKYSHVNNLKPCNNCELEYICGGDCRLKFFSILPECDFEKIENGKVPERKCDPGQRNMILDLMIRTNEFIFQ